jgi:hybrid cluster-associated redox disulfide protein
MNNTNYNKPVTRNSIIGDIIREYPFAIEIFMDYGVHCVGCHVSDFETLEQGILGHGFSEGELLDIIDELNEMILNPPENYDAI